MDAVLLEDLATSIPALVIGVEYPGYGLCPGTPCESELNRVMHQAFDYAHRYHGIPADQIVLVGRSIGSGPATEVAVALEERGTHVGGLALIVCHRLLDFTHPLRFICCLQSPYTSIKALAGDIVSPWAGLFVLDRFCNQHRLSTSRVPLYLIHGKADTLIAPHHSESLHAASIAPRKWLQLLPGVDHNSFRVGQFAALLKEFAANIGCNSKPAINITKKISPDSADVAMVCTPTIFDHVASMCSSSAPKDS